MGHHETGHFVKAVHYGSVAASFAMGQIGVVRPDETASPVATETWNGELC